MIMGHFKYGSKFSNVEITWKREISKETKDEIKVTQLDFEDGLMEHVVNNENYDFSVPENAPLMFLELVHAYTSGHSQGKQEFLDKLIHNRLTSKNRSDTV